MSGFPTNFTAKNLLELLDVHEVDEKEKSSKAKTLHCENGVDDNAAVARCVDCGVYLCDSCWNLHKKMVATRKHVTASLEEVKKSDGEKYMHSPRYCHEHESEVLKLYCKTCSKPICGDCTYVDHRDHKYVFLKAVQEELRQELESAMKSLEKKQSDFQGQLKSIRKVQSDCHTNTSASEQHINQMFDSFIERLQVHRGEVLGALQMAVKIEEKHVSAEADIVELSLAKLSSILNFMKRLLQSGSDVEVASMATRTLERSKNLQGMAYEKGTDLVADVWSLGGDLPSFETWMRNTGIVHYPPPHTILVEGIKKVSCGRNRLTVKLTEAPPLSHNPYIAAVITHSPSDGTPDSDVPCTTKKTQEHSWVVSFIIKKPGKCTVAITINKSTVKNTMSAVDLCIGTRVRRGPDWKWKEQDKHGLGTVIATVPAPPAGWAHVHWNHGMERSYRWGAENAFDLEVV